MKKWRILVLTMLVLLLAAMSPMAVLAQSDEAALTSDTPPANGALAIIAPWVTAVGQKTSMRVFLRADQEPFPGAGIGRAIGPAIGGFIFDINGSYSVAFLIGAVVMVVVTLLIALIRRETSNVIKIQ